MFKKLLLTSALLAAFATAHAQSSAPFGITGSIAPPVPTVTISNGGNSVVGAAAAAALRGSSSFAGTNHLYAFPAQILSYSITFSAPSKIALSFTDNNSGKVLPFDGSDSTRFGSVNGTTSSGSLVVTLENTKIDNTTPSVFLSTPNGTTAWSTTTVGGKASNTLNGVAPGYTTGFAKTAGATVPDSFTTLTGNLSMTLYMGKSLVDNATTTLTPSSSGTFTIVYL